MRVVSLIFAASAFGLAAIVPAAAFAPGALGTSVNARATAGEASPVVDVKFKGRPPGWREGRKTGWRGRGMPPGQLKKRRF
jgi:hypothetical protein